VKPKLLVSPGKEDVLGVTAKERTRRTSRRKRTTSVLEQLIAGCDAERVAVQFLDGRLLEGALLFNPIKRSGKLINVEQEFSLDFEPLEVKEIRVLQSRTSIAPMDRLPPVLERPVPALAVEDDSDDE
jgi:hypothetical protein